MKKEQVTPMMKQYLITKEEYPDCILFYRLGDFYEMFFEDAKIASRELEIALTGKDCGMEERAPMCGIPFHSAAPYIAKLVERGYKVAVCEQVEDPKQAKGIVKREVVKIVTPGTVVEDLMLDEKKNNYLAAVYSDDKYSGMVFSDISTGELYVTIVSDKDELLSEIARYQPSEIVINKKCNELLNKEFRVRIAAVPEIRNDDFFEGELDEILKLQFNYIPKLEFVEKKAVFGILKYLEHTQKQSVGYINNLEVYEINQYMDMDPATRRNLEITETMRDKAKRGSLLWVLDKTKTAMGARLLKQYIEKPLLNPVEINKRLYSVNELCENIILRDDIRAALAGIYDISRILGRICLKTVIPAELLTLKNSIACLPELKYQLSKTKTQLLSEMGKKLDLMQDIYKLIDESIYEDLSKGIIKPGKNSELDELRFARDEGHSWIVQAEAEEKEQTGIKNLKIRYNKVFGYYIEVGNLYKDKIPEHYIRKQTLVNCERYITPKLKEMENIILGSAEKIEAIESQIFENVRESIELQVERIREVCNFAAVTDVIASLAEVAFKYNFTMPEISTDGEIVIKDGRHPVVEKMLSSTMFVPNDTILKDSSRLMIITGPNMAGKSTYMRQVALITLMAQIGSFVPASYAKITPVDRIFTRVGASDDIASGQSTFMLEMVEVAAILKHSTKNSLVILDEIGRGTSTFDGLSIAWAVAEYMQDKKKCGAKTLFATHYHEMTALEEKFDGVKNYNIAVKKHGDEITFLRKIVRGGTDDSYGIEVAALAGLPKGVIKRAKEILKDIEADNLEHKKTVPKGNEDEDMQLGLGENISLEIIDELKDMDVTVYTPIEAMNKLYELSKRAKDIID